MRSIHRITLTLCLLLLAVAGLPQGRQVAQAAPDAGRMSYFGMNVYVTKRERPPNGDNISVLADTAVKAGVTWTREELPWDLIEQQDDQFLNIYDGSLTLTYQKGLKIIGMLLTTPAWARDPNCRAPGPTYWCPPAKVSEYAEFAKWMVERYDGDGVSDAPNHPRIDAWEIWNEPNNPVTWPKLGDGWGASRTRYGDMLVASYNAIKAADPTAKVLVGGIYVFDGRDCNDFNCDGLWFLNGTGGVFKKVPAARNAFDVLSIHPYVPTAAPDAPTIGRLYTIEGRVRSTKAMLNATDVNRGDAKIWITEIGWCTAPGSCPGGVQVSEDQQANYLIRSMVIAQQLGVQHTSWFQLDDSANNPSFEWAELAIVNRFDGTKYPPKKAYWAYKTLARQLESAIPAGKGPIHTYVYDATRPYNNENGTYDYRYTAGTTTIDVIWRASGSTSVSFPVISGKVVRKVGKLGGAGSQLTPSNGKVALTVSENPIFIIQSDQ
jgi:hypothetical protein